MGTWGGQSHTGGSGPEPHTPYPSAAPSFPLALESGAPDREALLRASPSNQCPGTSPQLPLQTCSALDVRWTRSPSHKHPELRGRNRSAGRAGEEAARSGSPAATPVAAFFRRKVLGGNGEKAANPAATAPLSASGAGAHGHRPKPPEVRAPRLPKSRGACRTAVPRLKAGPLQPPPPVRPAWALDRHGCPPRLLAHSPGARAPARRGSPAPSARSPPRPPRPGPPAPERGGHVTARARCARSQRPRGVGGGECQGGERYRLGVLVSIETERAPGRGGLR